MKQLKRLKIRSLRGSKSEDGAALVEFALILTFLVLLVTGIYEVGTAWKTSQDVSRAARSGARVGTQLAVRGEADYEILKSIESDLGGDMSNLGRIVVYEADGSGNMPSACESATPGYSGSAKCNVYGPAQFAMLASPAGSEWGSGDACGSVDANWCSATERSNGPTAANLTNLGVHVELQKPSVTQLFGSGPIELEQSAVFRVEPGGEGGVATTTRIRPRRITTTDPTATTRRRPVTTRPPF